MASPKPYKLCPIELPESRGFRDYAMHSVLKIHRDFLKLEPIKPLLDNAPLQVTFKSCQYHLVLKPEKPCMDCFLVNYFGPDLSTSAECAQTALEFKNSTFQIPLAF